MMPFPGKESKKGEPGPAKAYRPELPGSRQSEEEWETDRFGVATIRSKVFPALADWMFIVAALFSAANEVISEGQVIVRILFGAAFVWMGVDLRRRTQSE